MLTIARTPFTLRRSTSKKKNKKGAAPAAPSEPEDGPELDQDDRNKEQVSMMRNE